MLTVRISNIESKHMSISYHPRVNERGLTSPVKINQGHQRDGSALSTGPLESESQIHEYNSSRMDS